MNAGLIPQFAGGLHWVRAELEQSLGRIRSLIEQAVENDDDAALLQRAAVEMRQVRGIAVMLRCHGAVVLLDEMTAAVQDLAQNRVQAREPAYATLLASAIQLGDYLFSLETEFDDCVLVLQPAVNELRLARGQPVTTEAELFVAQLRTLDLRLPSPAGATTAADAAQAEARRLLPTYQAALLAWIRGGVADASAVARVGKIAEHIAQLARGRALHQYWRAVAALVEAWLSQALDDTLDLKRQLGRTGVALKLLAERGEAAAETEAGGAWLQLLFLVGRSRGQGPRVRALRETFQLARRLPTPAQLEARRRRIHGPGTALLARVADEIRSEFVKVKDRIDLAVRAGGQLAEADDTQISLKRIANTLTTLGLDALQRVVAKQALALQTLDGRSQASEWMDVATAILQVESSLERALFLQLGPPRESDGRPQLETKVPATRDLAESFDALYRESMINLARIKAAVDAFLRNGSTQDLPEAVLLLDEIASGLEIVGIERAGGLLRRLRRFVAGPAFAGVREEASRAERFADAVACTEYYLESLRERQPLTDGILDALAHYVDELERSLPAVEAAAASALAPAPVAAEAAPPIATAAGPAAGDEDPEIREIFLEEAGEVRAVLQDALPAWTRNPQDRETLTTIRRAFHTLKGSGRTVGATEIGEFGYAVENLLNRCLDGSIPTSTGVVGLVGEAVGLLPGLIEAFRRHDPAVADVAALIARAQEYAQGRDPAAASEANMAEIFRADAREKLEQVAAWIAGLDRARSRVRVDAEAKRAFHTLRGAAQVVDAPAMSEVAGAVETYFDRLDENQESLDADGLALVETVTATLRAWVEEVGTRAVQAHDAAPWLQRLREIQGDAAEAPAAGAAADRELVEIFTHEAFDLVQKMEEALRNWSQTPAADRAPQELRAIAHTLKGAAMMSACVPIGNAARALQTRIEQAQAGRRIPDEAAFAELGAIAELFYQQLDAYRDGTLRGEGEVLVRRIDTLRWNSSDPVVGGDTAVETGFAPLPETVAVATGAAAPAEPSTPPVRLPELPEPLQLPDLPDPAPSFADEQPALAIFPESASEPAPEPADAGIDVAAHAEIVTLQTAPTAPSPMSVPTAAADPIAPAATEDPELLAIFIAEAEELLEGLDQAAAALERDPRSARAQHDLQRILHTFKGSARMAGLPQLGEVAHRLESLLEAVERGTGTADALFFSRLSNGNEALQLALDALRRNLIPDLAPALEALDAPPPAATDAAAAGVVETGAGEAVDAEAFDVVGLVESEDVAAAPVEFASPPAPAAEPEPAAAPQPAVVDGTESAEKPVAVTPAVDDAWEAELFWRPEEETEDLAGARRETARVAVEALDRMLNEAGEISIYRSRLEEHNTGIQAQLDEMAQAIQRIRDQMRQLQAETDAQIAARGLGQATEHADRYAGEFDPLEMDRYTRMQELARALNESISDLGALHATMDALAGEAVTVLSQQGRVNTDVQQGLMRTLMVPFSRQVARLQRVVQQTAQENGKRAEIHFSGVEAELDRKVLERMTAPLEHLLRNAIVHGIESPQARVEAGKDPVGRIDIVLGREGTQLFIELRDDGRGLDFAAIRDTAVRRGLMPAGMRISDEEAAQFIFLPGFSTAQRLTQDAGRGVGMDVVASEVRQLGGVLDLSSESGRGARFSIRLPLTLAMSQALLVDVAGEQFAVPLSSVEGIARVPRAELDRLRGEDVAFSYGGVDYRLRHFGDFVGLSQEIAQDARTLNALLVRLPEGLGAGERRFAVVVDALAGNREIVSKAVGAQVSAIPGITGATILADGRVVLIVDAVALIQDRLRRNLRTLGAEPVADAQASSADAGLIMVVDDSITIRRVTERLLLKNGYRVITARDGLDAMAQLQTQTPAAILLDIEMPRADGFEVASFVRNAPRIASTPIVMITSRSGDKHRERARSIGVDRYLIKPYLEDQLLDELGQVLGAREVTA